MHSAAQHLMQAAGTARERTAHHPLHAPPPSPPPLPPTRQAKRQFQFQREWHYEEVLDAAFESHHHQMENSVNMFATINRMSQVLTQVS
jgi:hypothetical protein